MVYSSSMWPHQHPTLNCNRAFSNTSLETGVWSCSTISTCPSSSWNWAHVRSQLAFCIVWSRQLRNLCLVTLLPNRHYSGAGVCWDLHAPLHWTQPCLCLIWVKRSMCSRRAYLLIKENSTFTCLIVYTIVQGSIQTQRKARYLYNMICSLPN